MHNKNNRNWGNNIFYGLLIFFGFAFAIGQLVVPKDFETSHSGDLSFSEDIVWVDDDGTRTVVQPEDRVFKGLGRTLVLETTVPEDVEDNMYLVFKTRHSAAQAWVGDRLVVDRDCGRYPILGSDNPTMYDFILLRSADAGKTIRIETKANYLPSTGRVHSFYYGTEMQVWMSLFGKADSELVLILLSLIMSATIVIGVKIVNTIFRAPKSLEYLGLGILLFAVNLALDSPIRQLLFKSVTVGYLIEMFMYPMMVWAFAKYIQSLQDGRYSRFYTIVNIIESVTCIMAILLHATGLRTMLQNMLLVLAISLGIAVGCIVTLIIDAVKKRNRSYRSVALGIVVFITFSFVSLLGADYIGETWHNIIFIVGMGFLLAVSTKKTLNDIMVIETEQKVAAMANETKSMFLATMSHDLRTPINTVMGMNELILRENPAEPINRYSLSIQRASRNLVDLVNDILDYSKMEDGMLEINEGSYNLGIVIADLSNMVKEKALEKKLALDINVQASLPKIVRGDEKRVKQIITNVLTNAVKYTDKGTITMNITGTVSPDNVLLLKVEVADTGQGIRPENLDRMFESFVRLEEKTNMSIDGLGLGLTITKKLLVAMEGSIDVKSEFGTGSTFTILIPQEVVDATEIGAWGVQVKAKAEESEEYTPILEAPEAEILAVDDNRMNLTVLKGLLRPTKVKVTLAKSGQECLDICKDKKFDLIFMDHMMPEMDGIEALHKLNELWRENGKGCPVVALTANAISGAREMYMREGFTDYMTKPVEAVELEKTLVRYLPKSKLSGNYSGLR